MIIGDDQRQSSLRYPIQNRKSIQNDLNQTTLANDLYQQIVDRNKNNYILNSNFSSLNNSYSQGSITTASNTSFLSNIFNIQIASIESKFKGNMENYSFIENKSIDISNQIASINQSIQQLRSQIEKVSSLQINSLFQPLSNKNRSNRNDIESFQSNFNSSNVHSLNKSFGEVSTSLLIFNDKFSMISDNLTKSEYSNLRRDLNKIVNLTKSNTNRLDKLDTVFDQRIIKENVKVTNFFEDVNSRTSQKFELFQSSTTNDILSITHEISDILKNVSNDRHRIALSHQGQIEQIQNNIKKPLIQFHSKLQNFQKENSSVLNDLKESISKSLNSSQDECSQMILNLNHSFDQIITETEKDFNGLQNEVIETVTCIKEKNENEMSSMANVVENEMRIQQENLKVEKRKFSDFSDSLNDQFKLNFKEYKKMINENEQRGFSYSNKLVDEKIKPALKPFENFESRLNSIEKRIVDCENSIDDTMTKMKINLSQSNEKINALTKSLDETRVSQKNRLDLIDAELRKIEIDKNQLFKDQRLISAEYIDKVEINSINEFDSKAIELEYKFEQLMYFIQNHKLFDSSSNFFNEYKKKKAKSKENNEKDNNNNDSILNDENEKVFSTSQLYSDPDQNHSNSNNELEGCEETYSTNTLTENPKNHQNLKKKHAKKLNDDLHESKANSENWDMLSNSEADDEETEEFTFNNKSLNSTKKT